jgi:gluconate 2-dehydrogenase gamma chain
MQSGKKTGILTRRQFVAASAAGGLVAAVGCKSSGTGNWEFLSDQQAGTLAALCDQIVPADDFPSASQAGVLNYIDRQLVRHYSRHQETYRDGLEAADAISRKGFGHSLPEIAPTQQGEVTRTLELENSAFFTLLRNHTFEGYYGSPRHGGNRDAQSWRMLGLSEPPSLGRAQYDLRKGSPS